MGTKHSFLFIEYAAPAHVTSSEVTVQLSFPGFPLMPVSKITNLIPLNLLLYLLNLCLANLQLRLHYMTIPYEFIRVVHMFRPKWLEMFKTNIQPWFTLSIVMYNCCFPNTGDIYLLLIPQT